MEGVLVGAREAHRQENFWSSCAALIVSSCIWSSFLKASSLILSVTPTSLEGMVVLSETSSASLDGLALRGVCRVVMVILQVRILLTGTSAV